DKNCFPFEALITSMQAGRPKYFIEKCAVSYAYSARYLEETLNDNENDIFPKFAGFAPVEFSSRSRLATLSGSDQSLERIGSSFDQRKIFKGRGATKAQFMDGLSENNIMLLYTHAAVNKSSGEPEIYFRDSILTLNNMVLTAEPTIKLISLAACETALGKSYQGEGIFSFSRAFASYGIPSSVANIWSVNDESTYRINELFYEYLSDGTPADIALQRAKLTIINNATGEASLPYYWAASILTGKSDIICKTNSLVFGFLSLAFCLSLAGLAWLIGFGVSKWMREK
ncbi:MAG TPA: CHAT domain-containing protein, partial [Flavitalea sp.]|nr:CHAT domain-containing protein [Flavitalea sp.]